MTDRERICPSLKFVDRQLTIKLFILNKPPHYCAILYLFLIDFLRNIESNSSQDLFSFVKKQKRSESDLYKSNTQNIITKSIE